MKTDLKSYSLTHFFMQEIQYPGICINRHIDVWEKRFASLKTLCKEPKHKEFMHRIVVTKRELFRYGIQSDDDCVYCGEGDSIDHTFSDLC